MSLKGKSVLPKEANSVLFEKTAFQSGGKMLTDLLHPHPSEVPYRKFHLVTRVLVRDSCPYEPLVSVMQIIHKHKILLFKRLQENVDFLLFSKPC